MLRGVHVGPWEILETRVALSSYSLSLSGCFSPSCPGCEVEWCTFVSIFSMSSDIRCFFSSSGGRVNSTDAPTFSSDELSKLNKALVNCSTRKKSMNLVNII